MATRKLKKARMIELLDELRELVETQCNSEPAQRVINTGRLEELERLAGQTGMELEQAAMKFNSPPMAPVIIQQMMPKRKGPKEWNEFKKRYITDHAGEKEHNELVKNAAVAYKAYKGSQGIPLGRKSRKVPKLPLTNSVAGLQAELRRINAQRANLSARVSNMVSGLPEDKRNAVMRSIAPVLQPSKQAQEVQNALNAMADVELTPAMSKKMSRILTKASMGLAKEAQGVNAVLQSLAPEGAVASLAPEGAVAYEAPLRQTLGRASLPVITEAEEASASPLAVNYPSAAEGGIASPPKPVRNIKNILASRKKQNKSKPKSKGKNKTRRVVVGVEGQTPRNVMEFQTYNRPEKIGATMRAPAPNASLGAQMRAPAPPPLQQPQEENSFRLNSFGRIGSNSPSASKGKNVKFIGEQRENGTKLVEIDGNQYLWVEEDGKPNEAGLFEYDPGHPQGYGNWWGYFNKENKTMYQTNGP